MSYSAEQVGALIQAVGGLMVIGLTVVFLPSYHGSLAHPIIYVTMGVTFCGLALGNFTDEKQRFGTTVAAIGSVGLVTASGYLFATAPGSLEHQLTFGAASIGAIALTANALAYRGQIPSVTSELLEFGGIGPLTAVILFMDLSPATDGPFRLIFFILGCGAVLYGVLVIGVAVILGIKERRNNRTAHQ